MTQTELEQKISAYKLEQSYLGHVGKFIEPAIAPLGYDWKIGIAIVSSFAAREVFVGTLATIYNVGADEEDTIKNRMADEVHPDGKPVFTLASGMSLMIFYAFAMQCMSTLAIVRKETNSWKWPAIQLIVMTLSCLFSCFCYLSSSLIPLPNEHHPYHYRSWAFHRIFGQTFFSAQKENDFVWWSRLWMPLAQGHIQDHHHNKPADKSKRGNICVFILLGFGNHFFHDHKDHGSCSKGQCIGKYWCKKGNRQCTNHSSNRLNDRRRLSIHKAFPTTQPCRRMGIETATPSGKF